MRSVSGQSFTFEWNPTRGDLSVGNLADYYPGNSYVDYVGLDVYDVEWATYPGMPTEFSDMETQTYGLNWLASFAGAERQADGLPRVGTRLGDLLGRRARPSAPRTPRSVAATTPSSSTSQRSGSPPTTWPRRPSGTTARAASTGARTPTRRRLCAPTSARGRAKGIGGNSGRLTKEQGGSRGRGLGKTRPRPPIRAAPPLRTVGCGARVRSRSDM